MSSLTPPSSPTLDAARATLGIPSFASRDESRRAYRALARLFHPDKGGDVTKFRKVQKAHEIIEGWFKQQGLIKSRGTVSSKDDNDVASQNEKGETKHENQNDDSNPLAPTQARPGKSGVRRVTRKGIPESNFALRRGDIKSAWG